MNATCAAPNEHGHRVSAGSDSSVVAGRVRWSATASLWFGAMTLGWVLLGSIDFSWRAVAVYLLSTPVVMLLGHSLGMHRKLIHDSYQCPKWLEYLLVYMGSLVGMAGPLGLLWIHDLRDHAQRQRQCHDYFAHRRPLLQDFWWQVHCRIELERPPLIRIEPSIAGDRFYRFLQHSWMLQQLPWALLLYALGGWSFVGWGCCGRVVSGVFAHWLVGHFAHRGPEHDPARIHNRIDGAAVQGRNVRGLGLLTMGESWHNNHHAFPGSARLGVYPGEWDPGWWTLVALRRLGLVWELRMPEGLPPRPERRAESFVARRFAQNRSSVG